MSSITCSRWAGIDPFVALPIGMIIMFCFGFALQWGLLNLIVRSKMLNTLLITFGLSVVITFTAQLLFTADFRAINPSYAGIELFHRRADRSRPCGWPRFVDRGGAGDGAVVPAEPVAAGPGDPRDRAEPDRGAALRGRIRACSMR